MQHNQETRAVGASLGAADAAPVLSTGKRAGVVLAVALASLAALPVHAAIPVPTEITDVFTDLGSAFAVLMAAGAVLFGVVRGGIALFKLASRVFSAAGA